MVRSNSASGVGRVAQCEALETRNLFATVGVDSGFKGGKFTTQFYAGASETADAVVTLKDGRVFVVGSSHDRLGNGRIVAAVFNKDGSLSKSFDGDGKVTLSADLSDKLYSVSDVDLLKDGNVLLTGYGYAVKLKTTGQVDTSFATKGVVTLPDSVEAFNIPNGFQSELIVHADGTTHYASYSPDTGVLRSAVLSTSGKFTSSLRRTVSKYGSLRVLDDSEMVQVGSNGTNLVKLYRSDLTIDSKFGNGGTLDLFPAYAAWAKAQKPWTLDGDDGTTTDLPPVSGFGMRQTTSGYVFAGEVFATTPKQPHESYEYGDYTKVNLYVSSTGKINKIAAGAYSGVTFTNAVYSGSLPGEDYPYSIGGVFTTTSGKDVTFVSQNNGVSEYVADFASAGDGKFYLVGQAFNATTSLPSFLVARTAYVG